MKKNLLASLSAPVLASALLCFLPLTAQAQNITSVNGKAVPQARFDAMLKQVLRSGRQNRSPELEAQIRDDLVLREILEQEAVNRGMATTAEYKEQIEIARQGLLIRELLSDVQKKNPVTDADMAAEYERYKQKISGIEYHARHILVAKEDQAKALLAQLSKGAAKFEDLAKKHSQDGSAAQGGDLGWGAATKYVPEFSNALTQLKKGETSAAPVKTSFGYHLIRLDDTRVAQPEPFEKMKPQISQYLGQMRVAEFTNELKSKAKTEYKFAIKN
jgi:peptidyl-prolyl cis-trans isomerase C